jgi:hypothetical protein
MSDSVRPGLVAMRVVQEPRGSVYETLLATLQPYCPRFSLVYVGSLSTKAEAIERELAGLELSRNETEQWPGTRIRIRPGMTRPIISHYRFDTRGLEILSSAPGLYAWDGPDRPQDLALYGPDGPFWLGTVAHEQTARLAVPDGVASILRAIHGLRLAPVGVVSRDR